MNAKRTKIEPNVCRMNYGLHEVISRDVPRYLSVCSAHGQARAATSKHKRMYSLREWVDTVHFPDERISGSRILYSVDSVVGVYRTEPGVEVLPCVQCRHRASGEGVSWTLDNPLCRFHGDCKALLGLTVAARRAPYRHTDKALRAFVSVMSYHPTLYTAEPLHIDGPIIVSSSLTRFGTKSPFSAALVLILILHLSNNMALRLDRRVAIVTGAGVGLFLNIQSRRRTANAGL